jgi:L-lactate dehydrogenase complex protein LldG
MSRDLVLGRIRAALARPTAHHPARPAPPEPARVAVGASDPVETFRERFSALGGRFHLLANEEALAAALPAFAGIGPGPVWVPADPGPGLDGDRLAAALGAAGVEVVREPDLGRAAAAAAGVTGTDVAIAESATLALRTRAGGGRLPSVLPPVHVAVLRRASVVATLGEALVRLAPPVQDGLTSAVLLVSGPSRTGDIEGRLVVGVHGPAAVHAVLLG